MARVFVTGSFNVDHVWHVQTLPLAGATLSGTYSTGPGGKGFNQAVAARRTGADVRFTCALGEDAGADLARRLCASDGIDLCPAPSISPSGAAGIFVDASGRNSIAIGAGANASLSADFVAGALQGIGADDIALCQLESPPTAVAQALTLARANAATTVLNPGPANGTLDWALLDQVDLLTPNETEFATLLARVVGARLEPDTVDGIDQHTLHALCRDLLPIGTVIVTLGASGCFVSHPEDELRGDLHAFYRIPAEPAKVVDTTGAGDAFSGALVAALAQFPERALIEHVRFANRYAALVTEHQGAAMAMPLLPVT